MAQYYQITIADTGETYRCPDTRSLLEGMEALGKKGIPVGCRNGGCGVCKVHITSGSYHKRVMSREYVSEADEQHGCLLSCRVKPASDITLSVIGKMKKNVCREVPVAHDPETLSSTPSVSQT